MSNDLHTSEAVWVYPKIDPVSAKRIREALHLNPILAQVLVSRGMRDGDQIRQHLYSSLPDLVDPFEMPEMEAAVDRIMRAIEKKEEILVYGDNDVDGMTGTALLTEFLDQVGARVSAHVPNRTELIGQTMMEEAFVRAKELDATLVITVDCGITAAAEIKRMVDGGVDVIVTDHHEPTEKIPLCAATLNPKLVNTTYPNRDLTGVGVAFKLAHAMTTHLLRHKMIDRKAIDLQSYLDLVALGTIADMGALVGENRVLVRYGLARLATTPRVGLRKLADISGVNVRNIRSVDVAAKLAPRLNSLGRIADPQKGVELLLVRDVSTAEKMAYELDLNNLERQKIEAEVSSDVEELLKTDADILSHKAIVLDSDKWHPGVIAIVTTRLSKIYNRPTVIIAIDNGVGKGSMRTIPEFPLLPILKENADILLNFGGHDYACGLTIAQEKIPEFRKRFLKAADGRLKDHDVISKLMIDARVDFDQLTFDLMESLSLLEPHGNESPPPILYCDAEQTRPPRVVGGNHLKLYLRQKGRQLEGIGFGMGHAREQLMTKNLKLRVAFTPQVNTFQNKQSIQLLVRDFKVL